MDSMKTIKVEGEHLALFPNEVDSVKNMNLAEEAVGDPSYIESSVKMGRPRKNYIVGSKPTDEEEEEKKKKKKKKAVPVNKVQVGLAPPPNLKSVRANVGSWSNPSHRARESHVKIINVKLNYNKV
jgi:hypothetical protein